MSEESDRRRANVDIGLKVGGVIVAGYFLRKIYYGIAGRPGKTTKVPFNFENTQIRKIWVGGDVGFHEEPDPWDPVSLADELFTVMNGAMGIGFGETPRLLAWQKILNLGQDRARYLHNYWLDKIDPVDTLARWINAEEPLIWSDEEDMQTKVLQQLSAWGVGF